MFAVRRALLCAGSIVLSEYLGAFAQVVADLDVAVVGRGQLLQDLLPLVSLRVGLLQTAEVLVGRLRKWSQVWGEGWQIEDV